jgi:hypothetical protein
MDVMAQVGQAQGRGESLEQVKERFRRWREVRRGGEHVPPALWAAAVELATAHGLQRIADELRVNRDGLSRRVERAGGEAQAGAADTEFVELFAAPPPASTAAVMRECVIELENARGAKKRVELNGAGLAGLAHLCRGLWGAA